MNIEIDTLWQAAIVVIIGVLASSGFWAYMQSRDKTMQATTRLLMGLAYDRITFIGMKYIDRGWITKDEYEDFRKYFYEPYKDLGGNGVGERIMDEIAKLPLRSSGKYPIVLKNEIQNKHTQVGDMND